MRTLIALLLPACAACAADAPPLKIHMIAAGEYDPEKSLAAFKKHLEAGWRVEVTTSFGSSKALENLDALKSADVLVLFARRTAPPEAQMKVIRAHWEAGKPIVGIRTASHAFQKVDNEVLDRKVFGGNYGGASSNGGFVTGVAAGAADHPVLKGVGPIKVSRWRRASRCCTWWRASRIARSR